MQVMAILVLAYPEFQKTKNNVKYSPHFESLLIPLNVTLQILLGFVNTVSTWYGPVSIVIPVRVSAQLLFNMFFFEALGIEKFPKDVRVGTYIVVLAALLLPIVGPTAQEGQDAVQLFDHFPAELWTSVLIALTTISGCYCIKWIGDKSRNGYVNHEYKFIIILIARIASAVLSTSIGKFLIGTSGLFFGVTLFGFVACSFVISSVAILQATETDQSVFVPASACGIQFMNAITGLVIWQDYLVVQSWSGYFTVMIQILTGVYLISSMDEYASSADSNYALAQSVKIQIGKAITLQGGKSVIAYAGGNLHSMFSPIIEEEEDSESENGYSYSSAGDTATNDWLRLSHFSYGSIDSRMMFTEEFEA